MPIRHGLPARLGPDTIRADDRRTTDPGPPDPLDDHRWPFYPMDQIRWLVRRLDRPRVPAAVLHADAPLPDPADEQAETGLSVPEVIAVVGVRSAPPELVDRVWSYVIAATRAHRGAWNLYALGLARPGLHRHADGVTLRRPPTVKRDVQHVMAAEMLVEIHRTEPGEHDRQVFAFDAAKPYVFARLLDHCLYTVTGKRWNRHNRDRRNLDLAGYELLHEILPDANAHSRLYCQPGRTDAYATLARLVAQTAGRRAGARLSRPDAALIALTHVIGHPMADAASLLGLSEPAARMRAHRAVKLITALLDRERADELAEQRHRPPSS
ncbi:hypothetical protein ACFQZ4_37910 [Catellatospora coxensis]|uniref:DNA-directed RNA polymerase specialized sigma24 family protein n=1 Tax=Catellatospora coxensis TaxID=310354 RepID=A0A8J3KXB2_9ACTN|nr:hypothetical protein [Catellatospora coxensis]GIG03655.1 hypothetical protein Cco03nite_03550 [Catellatospora coxensis]